MQTKQSKTLMNAKRSLWSVALTRIVKVVQL